MDYYNREEYSENKSKNDFKNEFESESKNACQEQNFVVKLSLEEKIRCLEEIEKKLKKILYVYDKSQEPNSQYNYKVYCGGVLIYVSSSNVLFGGELVSIVVNLNAILTNNFSKGQIKRIVFESKNFAQYLATNYRNELNNYSNDDCMGVDTEQNDYSEHTNM